MGMGYMPSSGENILTLCTRASIEGGTKLLLNSQPFQTDCVNDLRRTSPDLYVLMALHSMVLSDGCSKQDGGGKWQFCDLNDKCHNIQSKMEINRCD